MSELLFPLQFKRQYSGPLDADNVFTTSAAMNAYLSNSLRYAGQIATCLDYPKQVFVMNSDMTAWDSVSSTSATGSVNIANLVGATDTCIVYGTSAGGLESVPDFYVDNQSGYPDPSYNYKGFTIIANDGQRGDIFLYNNNSYTGDGHYIWNKATSAAASFGLGYTTDTGSISHDATITWSSVSPNLESNVGLNIPSSATYNVNGVPHNHDGRYASSAHGHAWSQVSATPTTLAGYGITDALASSTSAMFATSGHTHSQYLTSAVDAIRFIPQAVRPAYEEGKLFYDDADNTLSMYSDHPDVLLTIGQENWVRVVNKSGADIIDGSVVYLDATQGNRPTIKLAIASSETQTERTIGVVTHTIVNGAEGYVTTFGVVNGYNTSTLSAGYPVYLSPTTSGGLTNTRPTWPNHSVLVGYALNSANNGSLFVNVDNGKGMDEIHDTLFNNLQNGDVLSYVSSASYWTNKQPSSVGLPQDLTTSASPTFENINITGLTLNVSAVSDVEGAIEMLDKVNKDQLTPSGFVSRTTTDFYYTSATRTVTVSATAGSYEFYNRGKYFVKSTDVSATHTSAFGQYFFYYNDLGNFVCNPVNTPWDFEEAQFTMCYHNETAATSFWRGPETIFMEERHGISMDAETHGEFHRTQGTYVVGSGFALNGTYVVAGTGSGGLADVSYGIDSGTIRDEDIPSLLSTLNDNNGVGDQYPVFYKTGAANEWRWYVNNIPMLFSTVGQNAYYNLNTAGTWSLGEITTTNRYYNMYVFAVPFSKSSTGYNYRYIWVMGQAIYTSLALAQSESVLSLDTAGFPFVEIAPLWQVTMRYTTSYSTASGKARIEGTKKIVGTSLSITLTGTVTTHNNLAGRSDADTHPATSITFTPTTNTPILSGASITDVQTALSAIDSGKSALVHNQSWSTITSTPTTLGGYGITDALASSTSAWFATSGHNHDGVYLSVASSATFASSAHNQSWSTITSTPTTLAGYGITDALSRSTSAQFALSGHTHTNASSTTTGFLTSGDWNTFNSKLNASAFATSGLSDVSAVAPLNGQTLVYSSATSKYIPSKGTSIDYGEYTEVLMPGMNWTSATATSGTPQIESLAYGNGVFVAIDTNAGMLLTSPDGITWKSQASPVPIYARYITYGNGVFVIVSSNTASVISTSIDGLTWTSASNAVTNLGTVCYGNGQFVASQFNGNSVITSPNGINWTTRSAVLPESGTWCNMCYGNGVYILVANAGGSNRLARSVDGMTWTAPSNPISALPMYDVAYGNGTFVAVGYSTSNTSCVITSPDGLTWTTRTVPSPDGLRSVKYGGGLFVAVGTAGFRGATSPDGITWTSRTLPSTVSWSHLVYGDGIFIGAGSVQGKVAISGRKRITENNSSQFTTNTQTFTNGIVVSGTSVMTSATITGMTTTSGTAPRYVVADYTGQLSTSPGLIRDSVEDFPHIPAGVIQDDIAKYWTKIEMGAGLETIQTICYLGNGIVLAGAGSGAGDGDVYRSTDYGLTWTPIEMGATLEYIFSMCYLGNGIVLAGSITTAADGGDVYRSTDYGLTWTKIELGSTLEYVPSVCYLGNGIALAGTGISTGDGDIYRSTDYGLTWALVEMGAALEQLVAICYIGNGIVLAGTGTTTGDGDIYRSVDSGVTWSLVEMGSALEKIYAIVYLGNGIVLAGAGSGTGEGDIYRSVDYGVTWSKIEMGSSIEIVYSICYIGNGIVLASTGYTPAGDGDVYKSTDYGLTWSMIEMGAGLEAIYTICYLGNGIVLVGAGSSAGDGDIYRSVTSWNTENANIHVVDNKVNFATSAIFTNGIVVSGTSVMTSATITGQTKITSLSGTGTSVVTASSTGLLATTATSALKPTLSKTLVVESPTAAEDITFFRTDVAITVKEVIAVLTGSTGVTYVLRHSTDRNATGNLLTVSGEATSTTTGTTATLSDDTIPADSWIWLETTALNGTPTSIAIDVRYTED